MALPKLETINQLISGDAAYFIEFAETIAAYKSRFSDIYNRSDAAAMWNVANNLASEIETEIKSFSFSGITKGALKLQTFFQSNILDSTDSSIYTALNESIEQVISDADQVFTNYSRVPIFSLVSRLDNFLSILNSFIKTYTTNIEEAHPQVPFDEAVYSQISIYLESEHNLYEEVLRKLQALKTLYSEICQLLGISEQDFPLQVIKVETGSLWWVLLGKKEVVELIRSSIKAVSGYLYRNHTKEGKIYSLPKQVEVIDKVIELKFKLEKAGIETSELEDQLRKSTIHIAESLNTLLDNESNIRLDGETQPLFKSHHKVRRIGPHQQYLLSPGENNGEEETSSKDDEQESLDL